ncbi:hypothetical protein ACFX2I_021735 [Malus domestica]
MIYLLWNCCGLGSHTVIIALLSHPDPGSITPRALLHRSRILSALDLNHALTVLFLGTHMSRTSQWIINPKNALAHFSLNFEVPTEIEASELPKCLVLIGDGYVHIRHIRSTPLGDLRSNIYIGS